MCGKCGNFEHPHLVSAHSHEDCLHSPIESNKHAFLLSNVDSLLCGVDLVHSGVKSLKFPLYVKIGPTNLIPLMLVYDLISQTDWSGF